MPSCRRSPRTIGTPALERLRTAYCQARHTVAEAGFSYEATWQANQDFHEFTESQLLRESAWVILCCGFRESIVRKVFDYISLCFCDWSSAKDIVDHQDTCRRTALKAIRHEAKIRAILEVARRVNDQGFDALRCSIIADPLVSLREFPYIGPTTAKHLAKNLGMEIAKPDRHLLRITEAAGIGDTQELCSALSKMTGDPISVVDIVLWRYATISPDYRSHFETATVPCIPAASSLVHLQ